MREPMTKFYDTEFIKNATQEEMNAVFEEQKIYHNRQRIVRYIGEAVYFCLCTGALFLIYNYIIAKVFELRYINIGLMSVLYASVKFIINIFKD